jgi:hypothetical protein
VGRRERKRATGCCLEELFGEGRDLDWVVVVGRFGCVLDVTVKSLFVSGVLSRRLERVEGNRESVCNAVVEFFNDGVME